MEGLMWTRTDAHTKGAQQSGLTLWETTGVPHHTKFLISIQWLLFKAPSPPSSWDHEGDVDMLSLLCEYYDQNSGASVECIDSWTAASYRPATITRDAGATDGIPYLVMELWPTGRAKITFGPVISSKSWDSYASRLTKLTSWISFIIIPLIRVQNDDSNDATGPISKWYFQYGGSHNIRATRSQIEFMKIYIQSSLNRHFR